MSDQMVPPEQAMPQMPPPMVQQDPAEVTDALLRACKLAAQKASAAEDTREMGDAAKAALAFAQAIVILDPTLGSDGVPLDHQLALAEAQSRAAAPTPARSIRP